MIYQLSDGVHTVDEIAVLIKQAFNLDHDVDVVPTVSELVEAKVICRVE